MNRGNWKRLEDYTRKLVKDYDSVLVWCGSVTIEFKHIGRVTVPDYCWKVLYIKKLNKVGDLHHYEVSLDSIQHLSKLTFLKTIEDSIGSENVHSLILIHF